MLSLIGTPTSNNVTQRNISTNLGGVIQLATEYGVDTFTNGNVSFYTASIDIVTGKQVYDLNKLVRDVLVPTGSIEIKRVHHYSPPAAMRFYDSFR